MTLCPTNRLEKQWSQSGVTSISMTFPKQCGNSEEVGVRATYRQRTLMTLSVP